MLALGKKKKEAIKFSLEISLEISEEESYFL